MTRLKSVGIKYFCIEQCSITSQIRVIFSSVPQLLFRELHDPLFTRLHFLLPEKRTSERNFSSFRIARTTHLLSVTDIDFYKDKNKIIEMENKKIYASDFVRRSDFLR